MSTPKPSKDDIWKEEKEYFYGDNAWYKGYWYSYAPYEEGAQPSAPPNTAVMNYTRSDALGREDDETRSMRAWILSDKGNPQGARQPDFYAFFMRPADVLGGLQYAKNVKDPITNAITTETKVNMLYSWGGTYNGPGSAEMYDGDGLPTNGVPLTSLVRFGVQELDPSAQFNKEYFFNASLTGTNYLSIGGVYKASDPSSIDAPGVFDNQFYRNNEIDNLKLTVPTEYILPGGGEAKPASKTITTNIVAVFPTFDVGIVCSLGRVIDCSLESLCYELEEYTYKRSYIPTPPLADTNITAWRPKGGSLSSTGDGTTTPRVYKVTGVSSPLWVVLDTAEHTVQSSTEQYNSQDTFTTISGTLPNHQLFKTNLFYKPQDSTFL
jgi:hypothetical protein